MVKVAEGNTYGHIDGDTCQLHKRIHLPLGHSHVHVLLQTLIERLHKIISGVEVAANLETAERAVNAPGQILGHDAGFDRVNAGLGINKLKSKNNCKSFTRSTVCAKRRKSSFPSNLPRWSRPLFFSLTLVKNAAGLTESMQRWMQSGWSRFCCPFDAHDSGV